MSFFQNIYGVLFRPSDTFKYLSANYNPSILVQALSVLVLVNLLSQGFNIAVLLGSMINWLFFASLFFLTAYIFVLSRQDYWRSLSLLAFANLPLIFLAPLKILSLTNPIISFLFQLGISIWIFNLTIVAISELCSISKTKSFLLYLIPPLALSFLLISFLATLFSSLVFMF